LNEDEKESPGFGAKKLNTIFHFYISAILIVTWLNRIFIEGDFHKTLFHSFL
jgi:hypothetical protein